VPLGPEERMENGRLIPIFSSKAQHALLDFVGKSAFLKNTSFGKVKLNKLLHY
jgi:hypothetical protein